MKAPEGVRPKFIRATKGPEGKPDRKAGTSTVIDKETGKAKDATPLEKSTDKASGADTIEKVKILTDAEKAGLIDKRGFLEVLAGPGDAGTLLEKQGKRLSESAKVEDQAMGLDMRYEGLIIQAAEIQDPLNQDGKPKTEEDKRKNLPRLTEIQTSILDIKIKRQKITTENPALAGNQFEDMARALVPGEPQRDGDGNVLAIKTVHDDFDRLTHLTLEQRGEVDQFWEKQGVPTEVRELLQAILFKKEFQLEKQEKKDKRNNRVKKTSMILVLLSGMVVWAAAKKAGEGGQTGR